MIYITGDTHAHFHDFTSRIEHAGIGNSDTAIVCGDFGFTLAEIMMKCILMQWSCSHILLL